MEEEYMEKWAYGIEAEMVGSYNKNPINGKYYISSEVCSVNSNGQACSWKYDYGGEVNTYPTETIKEQRDIFDIFLRDNPEATVNYRSTLHTHVRIPGLENDIQSLKKVLSYVMRWTPWIINRIYVLKNTENFKKYDTKGSLWRFLNVGTVMLPRWRFNQIMKANTASEFFYNHMLTKEGKYVPLQAKRYAVNFLMLPKTGTLEFRHFHGPENSNQVYTALDISKKFLEAALSDKDFDTIWYKNIKYWELPPPKPLDVELEKQYHETKVKDLGRSTPKYVINGTKVGGGSSK